MDYIGAAPFGALLLVLFSTLWIAAVRLILRPYFVTRFFRKQGVRGPPYRFWSGSLAEVQRMRNFADDLILDNIHCHDITMKVFPHVRKFTAEYGETYLTWFGAEPTLEITDPEMVKQILSNKFGFFPKMKASPALLPLLGKGLVLTTGAEWARHRALLKPAFTMDKLKLSARTTGQCVKAALQLWQDQINEEEDHQIEVEVSGEFQQLTADVIAHAAFGSSYREGEEAFLAQRRLRVMALQQIISGNAFESNWLPTRKNLEKWKLEKILRNNIMAIIKSRLDREGEDSGYGNDLLGLMLEANQNGQGTQILSMDEIIDECKTFLSTGHETTAVLLTWAVFLLSINQDWQEKLRKEVVQVCGEEIPNPDMLGKLKLVHMVLLETLRLYSPIYLMTRKATKDVTLGNIQVPKDTRLMIPVPMVHRNKRIWGVDAHEFQPLRFENGIFKAAAHPNALIAFSLGPRVCIGQDFAMLEAKTVLAMILQSFSFCLSPKYKHAPTRMLTITPKFGVPIILKQMHA